MRRLLLVLTVVLTTVLASTGPAGAAARSRDLAEGKATSYLGTAVFRVTSNPDGTNPQGRVQLTVDAGNGRQNVYTGKATCLQVFGSDARMYGLITSSHGPTKQPYRSFTLSVVDNSPSTTAPDQMYFEFFQYDAGFCLTLPSGGFLTRGYVTVHDAP
jgi:hypothetical protein